MPSEIVININIKNEFSFCVDQKDQDYRSACTCTYSLSKKYPLFHTIFKTARENMAYYRN